MIASNVQPFVQATAHVFNTMLQITIAAEQPTPIERDASVYDVTGVIGMSGDVVGVVMLCFPAESAQRIVEKFAGVAMEVGTDDFGDAVGELVNMVAGNAKSRFDGKNASISCPSVVFGSNHKVAMPSDAVGIAIPFTTPCGPFTLKFSLKAAGNSSKTNRTANGTVSAGTGIKS